MLGYNINKNNMTFWALGAFDKVKNMTEKLNIKDVSKKVRNYVVIRI